MTWLVIAKLIGLAIYPVIEYFLGKTDHGSVLGVILNLIKAILESLGIKKIASLDEGGKK